MPLLGAVGKSQHSLPACYKKRTHSVGLWARGMLFPRLMARASAYAALAVALELD